MENGAYIVKGKELDDKGKATGKDKDLIYTCSDENLNKTYTNNQSSLCACLDPFTGVNCGAIGEGIDIKLAAGIAAGIIAAIVVLAILGLVLFGGGAYAATTALAAAPNAAVDMNPLYQGAETAGDNPLYG
jgi:hypothetical protein